MKICVVGAGLFGSMAAVKLSQKGHAVDLWEANADILLGASKHNHNRIHFGYHYPRSIETARESQQGYATFFRQFRSAIMSDFPNYYAIGAAGSKTTPQQFEHFCRAVNIELKPEFPDADLLDRSRIAECYRVNEPVFDYAGIHSIVKSELNRTNVQVHLNSPVTDVKRRNGLYFVTTGDTAKEYDVLVIAVYHKINRFNVLLQLATPTYLYENVFIPVFRYSAPAFGVTVMDGEFCSIMPKGRHRHEFLLYHVKHSVLQRHFGSDALVNMSPAPDDAAIFQESSRFMPFLTGLASCAKYQHVRIVRENKDDARRSILNNDLPNYWSILSGKVTTCVDIAEKLANQIERGGD